MLISQGTILKANRAFVKAHRARLEADIARLERQLDPASTEFKVARAWQREAFANTLAEKRKVLTRVQGYASIVSSLRVKLPRTLVEEPYALVRDSLYPEARHLKLGLAELEAHGRRAWKIRDVEVIRPAR